MEGWVNPVKTFGHKTLGVFYVNSKDRFYRQGTHLITFVYDNGSSEVKLEKRMNTDTRSALQDTVFDQNDNLDFFRTPRHFI